MSQPFNFLKKILRVFRLIEEQGFQKKWGSTQDDLGDHFQLTYPLDHRLNCACGELELHLLHTPVVLSNSSNALNYDRKQDFFLCYDPSTYHF